MAPTLSQYLFWKITFFLSQSGEWWTRVLTISASLCDKSQVVIAPPTHIFLFWIRSGGKSETWKHPFAPKHFHREICTERDTNRRHKNAKWAMLLSQWLEVPCLSSLFMFGNKKNPANIFILHPIHFFPCNEHCSDAWCTKLHPPQSDNFVLFLILWK